MKEMTLQDMIELYGDLQDIVKRPAWNHYVNACREAEQQRIEMLIASSDSDDEKIKGQIQGIRETINLMDILIKQLKEVVLEKGGEK